jgi:hypothetical protein
MTTTTLRGKVTTTFPATITGESPIVVTNAGGSYTIGIDAAALQAITVIGDDAIEFVIDSGGAGITTGVKGYFEVPFACEISKVTLLGDQSGTVVVDIWKCTYDQFDGGVLHPINADSITALAPPTITASTKSQDSNLTGWTTAIAAGDVLAFVVETAGMNRVTISLTVAGSLS